MQTVLNEGFTISLQQERLWSLQTKQEKTYISQATIRIEGALDPLVLRRAFALVVQKHEVLRTTFRTVPGLSFPLQTIKEQEDDVQWDIADLSQMEEYEQTLALKKLLTALSEYGFDYEHGPLYRVALVTLSSTRYELLVVLSALCVDAVSLQHLTSELSRAYASILQKHVFDQDILQYADFAAWQEEIVKGEEADEGRRYWKREDLSAFTQMQLPFEKHLYIPKVGTSQTYSFQIDSPVVECVTALAKKYTCSLSTLLFTCWHTLLWRLTNQQLQTLSFVVDGRHYEELQEALGLFARSVPVTGNLTAQKPFCQLLRETQQKLLEVTQWQDFFQWKAPTMDIQASGANDLLYIPAGFAWTVQPPVIQSADVTFQLRGQLAEVDYSHLKLECVQTDASIQTYLHYNASLFASEDIASLQDSFLTLLQSILDAPEEALSKLTILSEATRLKILKQFNNTSVTHAHPLPLPLAFEGQVAKTPDAPAVRFHDQVWTYKELNTQANHLAAYLRRQGIGLEARVGICMERSLELVVALLGVLKVGGTYIPIDPEYPEDRIHFMLKDAEPALVLTQKTISSPVASTNVPVLYVDSEWAMLADELDTNVEIDLHAQCAAYIIYTSGSTGLPKGVLVTHQALSNHMEWMQETFRFTEADHIFQRTPYSFDASVWEFYAPLLCGGQLVLAEPGKHGDPTYLLQAITQHQITIVQMVPSLLRVLLQTPQGLRACSTFKTVFCGGEELTLDLQKLFFSQSEAALYNLYGPSETCIDATFWRCSVSSERVPIGKPISQVEAYILDEDLAPVPIGVMGELYIGGAGVGRGYYQRPALTAERFIPHPFYTSGGARVYKTGDMACYRTDGVIEFLGRNDSQVKLRGFRIELGEIENVLLQHPAITGGAVVIQEQQQGDKRLVGYVVCSQDPAQVLTTLHQFLASRLPEYMLPSAFGFLDALPLMPNGKVDRQVLTHYSDLQTSSGISYEAPRTVLEEILVGIWQDLLSLDRIGINDNFFRIGGHSLLITRVVARIQHEMGIELSLRSLFDAPTIAELAEIVTAQLSSLVDREMLQQLLMAP